jgi:hypothetical protein
MERIFKKEQFDGMILNPFELSDDELDLEIRSGVLFEAMGSQIWQYPSKYRPFLIRYILYLYDKGSELRRYFPDIAERKKICAELAGLDFHKKTHQDKAEEFYELSNKASRLSMISFIKHQNNVIYGLYWSNIEHLWKLISDVSKKFTEFSNDKAYLEGQKIKSQMLELAEETLGRIKKHELELFQGDDLAKELTAKTRQGSYPEDMATIGNVY